jgi:hypothetical protein
VIAAYREKPSLTCDGALRFEYRVHAVEDVPGAALSEAWGRDWGRHYPETKHVVEERRVLCGVAESWRFHSPARSLAAALDCMGGQDLVVLEPEMRTIWEARQTEIHRERDEHDARKKARLIEEREARDAREQRRRSDAAFERLAASQRDGHWAERWNAFLQAVTKDQVFLARAGCDDRFQALHDAVIAAKTVPSKRKAIREFLAYAELFQEMTIAAHGMGRAAASAVARSQELQETNERHPWRVTGFVNDARVGRVCHNWAGARLAMYLLQGRGARFVSYERLAQTEQGSDS